MSDKKAPDRRLKVLGGVGRDGIKWKARGEERSRVRDSRYMSVGSRVGER